MGSATKRFVDGERTSSKRGCVVRKVERRESLFPNHQKGMGMGIEFLEVRGKREGGSNEERKGRTRGKVKKQPRWIGKKGGRK